MLARPMVFTAFALSLLAGWVTSEPRTTKYRVETKNEQVVDLSAVGQGEQRQSFGLVNFLTITLNDTAGGHTVHAVLDSMVKADSNPIPAQISLDSARGRTWHALLSPDGKITNVQRLDSTGGGQGTELLVTFFPRVKQGAKVGDQWTDTTEVNSDSDGQALTTRTVTNYSVTGTETRNGARALKIEAAFSLAQTGEITQPTGTLGVEGTGQGTAVYYVAADGRYLGGTSNTNADLKITTDQLPAPIPVQVISSVKVDVVP
jgi:hypothetical protein